MIAHHQSSTVGVEIVESIPAVGMGGDLGLRELVLEQMHDDKAQFVIVLRDEKTQCGQGVGNKADGPDGSERMHVRKVTAQWIEPFISNTRSA